MPLRRWRRDPPRLLARPSPARRLLLALVLGALAATPLIAVGEAYEAKTERDVSDETERRAELARYEWERYVRDRTQPLRQLASFWQNSREVEVGEFRDFTMPILQEFPGLQRIVLLQPDGTTLWTMPPDPHAEIFAAPAPADWQAALDAAREEATGSRRLVVSNPTTLPDGSPAYIVVATLHESEPPHVFEGFAVAQMTLDLNDIFSEDTRNGFAFQVIRGGVIGRTGGEPAPGAPRASTRLELPATVRGLGEGTPVLVARPTIEHVHASWEDWLMADGLRATGAILGTLAAVVTWRETGRVWERRRAAAALVAANRELALKVRDLDSFSQVVAHDLKNPLRGVDAAAHALQEDHGDSLAPDARENVQRIRASTARMAQMIDAILAYARAGASRYDVERVEASEVIAQALDDVAPLLQARRAEVEVAPDLPVLAAQRVPLEEVFANLVSNAVNHNPSPTPRVRIAAEERADAWEFHIADNGPGVPPREREHIFDLFRRGSAAKRGTGTGVGLATVKRVVEGHGGRIWVDDAPGGGALFRFTIPRRPA